jgi:hypothetical protein
MRSMRIAAAFLSLLFLASSPLRADDGCRTFSGNFTAVPPPDCPSPFGICTHGTLTGGFPSTYDFVMDTLVPIGKTGLSRYTGHSVITTADGLLFGSDSGIIKTTGPGAGSFVTVVRIVGGTGEFEGARGSIVAPGRLDFATGNTVGRYFGAVCTGN